MDYREKYIQGLEDQTLLIKLLREKDIEIENLKQKIQENTRFLNLPANTNMDCSVSQFDTSFDDKENIVEPILDDVELISWKEALCYADSHALDTLSKHQIDRIASGCITFANHQYGKEKTCTFMDRLGSPAIKKNDLRLFSIWLECEIRNGLFEKKKLPCDLVQFNQEE